jgi:hypothetical protein
MSPQFTSLVEKLKEIFQIDKPELDFGIYRILRFTETKNIVTLVVGIICLATGIGNFAAWLVDLVTVVTKNRITVLAD